jgi:hypothetical protein
MKMLRLASLRSVGAEIREDTFITCEPLPRGSVHLIKEASLDIIPPSNSHRRPGTAIAQPHVMRCIAQRAALALRSRTADGLVAAETGGGQTQRPGTDEDRSAEARPTGSARRTASDSGFGRRGISSASPLVSPFRPFR